jgi:putative ABC transport system permease protein
MTWVAWKMLTGDRAKYFGLVFGIAFACLLMAHQMSIFCGIMRRTGGRIVDVREAEIWVTQQHTTYVEELKPMPDTYLYRVRGVPGVAWAVPYFKSQVQVRFQDGNFRNVLMIGTDDATLIGAPTVLHAGSLADLRRPDAFIIDKAGYTFLWPEDKGNFLLGKTIEINDRRAILVGVCESLPTFQTLPVIFTRFSQARTFAPPERNQLHAILAHAEDGVSPAEVCQRIEQQTSLTATTDDGLYWMTIKYYLRSTGIPINFGITIFLGFFVGAAIAGQTFYLFVIENLKQFGSLKAMGLGNLRIVGMILAQVAIVTVIGYGIGLGLAAGFFEATKNQVHLAGFYLMKEIAALVAIAVSVIAIISSFLAMRKVLTLEPAVVFK